MKLKVGDYIQVWGDYFAENAQYKIFKVVEEIKSHFIIDNGLRQLLGKDIAKSSYENTNFRIIKPNKLNFKLYPELKELYASITQ